jgi:predicted RNA methylase
VEAEQIELRLADIRRQFGEWTAHTIDLGRGLNTWDKKNPKFPAQVTVVGNHLRRIMQVIADVMNRPFASLRVLDLACLEGLYGIELARQGAEVVSIEVRQANLEKARFAKEVLGLANLTLVQDDVRNLSAEKYGSFDVVLCLGLLYHLDAPDVFQFLEKMSEVCRRMALIDTHVAVQVTRSCQHRGREYHGLSYAEHLPEATAEQKEKALWSSLDNVKSFWFTRPSLYNILSSIGFTSVYDCHTPHAKQTMDRDTLVAVKGQRVEPLSTPAAEAPAYEWCPEQNELGLHPVQQGALATGGQAARGQPRQGLVRRILKRIAGGEGG